MWSQRHARTLCSACIASSCALTSMGCLDQIRREISPGRWRWETSSCRRRSGVPACLRLCSGTGWRNKTAGWRPGEPARGSAPWCSLCTCICLSVYLPALFFTSLMSLCVRIFTWLNLPACPCFSCPPTVCVLLPCYGDDERGRSVISTVCAVIAGVTVCWCFLKEHIAWRKLE